MSDIQFASAIDRATWFFRQLWWNLERQAYARRGDYRFSKPWEEINDLLGSWN